jgi:hypothetical protein
LKNRLAIVKTHDIAANDLSVAVSDPVNGRLVCTHCRQLAGNSRSVHQNAATDLEPHVLPIVLNRLVGIWVVMRNVSDVRIRGDRIDRLPTAICDVRAAAHQRLIRQQAVLLQDARRLDERTTMNLAAKLMAVSVTVSRWMIARHPLLANVVRNAVVVPQREPTSSQKFVDSHIGQSPPRLCLSEQKGLMRTLPDDRFCDSHDPSTLCRF